MKKILYLCSQMKLRILFLVVAILLCGSCRSGQVAYYNCKVEQTFPHDEGSYTQGLFFHNGVLYESTGQYGESTMRKVDIATGDAQQRMDFDSVYFAEGSCILGGKLYVLTWMDKVAFMCDPETFEYHGTVRYPREGWGLTTDGKELIASDGTPFVYFMDGAMKMTRRIKVTLDGHPVRNLNELEWIGGKIWANVYLTDTILIINPKDGKVEGRIDCRGLLEKALKAFPSPGEPDVLNGIAVSPDGRIFLTGKYWPALFEVRLKK